MKALFLSPAAKADIAGIWQYSAVNWGPDQADRYTDEIRDICHALASGTKQGRAVTVRPDYQKIPCGSHVVYFREKSSRIEVIRILHARQDVERNL